MERLLKISKLSNLIGLVAAWLLIFGFFWWRLPAFGSLRNLELLARQSTIVAMAALGMTLVIISGAIDLSVGSIVALVTIVIAWFLREGHGPWVSLLAGLGAGALCGLLNGTLITRLKVGPFIVTLGSLLIFRGIAKWIGDEQKIDAPATWLPSLLSTLPDERRWMIVPPGVWLMALFSALMAWLLSSTRFGRHVVAVGSNENAARLCGVPVERVRLVVFVLMGFFAALAGLMQFARLTVGDPTVAVGLELDVIAAVVIGGASLAGGQGSILGSLIGAFIMATIRAGSSQMGLATYVQEIVTGVIIVLAVTIDRVRVRKNS